MSPKSEDGINLFGKDDDGLFIEPKSNKKKPDLERVFFEYRLPFLLALVGVIFVGVGIIYFRVDSNTKSDIEIINNEPTQAPAKDIVVEVSGAVQSPGVYKLGDNSRIEDLLISAGGFSANADRDWIAKNVNRAAILADGQKVYIPKVDEQSDVLSAKNSGGLKIDQTDQGSGIEEKVNINSASQKELEDLPGIGPVYAQSIIEHRPYSDVPELVSKDALKQGVYEKIKDLVSVY